MCARCLAENDVVKYLDKARHVGLMRSIVPYKWEVLLFANFQCVVRQGFGGVG